MEFTIPVEQDTFEKAGSKFISFDPTAPIGTIIKLPVEMGMPDWDTPNVSIKFPVTIIGNGQDAGKTDKVAAGVGETGVWKLKEILAALECPLEMRQGTDGKNRPVFKGEDVAGKNAMGVWEVQKGKKGGDPNAEDVVYPKLVGISAS